MKGFKLKPILVLISAASATIIIQPLLMVMGTFLQLFILDGLKDFGEIFLEIKRQLIDFPNEIVVVSGVLIFFIFIPVFLILNRIQRSSLLNLALISFLASVVFCFLIVYLLNGSWVPVGDNTYTTIIVHDVEFSGFQDIVYLFRLGLHWVAGSFIFLVVYKKAIKLG